MFVPAEDPFMFYHVRGTRSLTSSSLDKTNPAGGQSDIWTQKH